MGPPTSPRALECMPDMADGYGGAAAERLCRRSPTPKRPRGQWLSVSCRLKLVAQEQVPQAVKIRELRSS